MATMNPPANERRHIPERRMSVNITRGASLTAMDWAAMVLMIVGAVNWGLLGAIDVNFLTTLFGEQTALTRIVYVVVGLAGLYGIYQLAKFSRR